MADIIKWPVVMVCPGEDELPLLADLSSRPDAQIVAVADPDGSSLGAGLAEIMGLTLVRDLADVPQGQARYLIHPPLSAAVAPFVDLAPEFGLRPVSTHEFSRLLNDPTPGVRPRPQAPVPRHDHEAVEAETAAIHRTLSRIEEALDREALLRWLLGLATRATGAGSGSIMLYDQATEELYVAFAYGLSQQTMHKTRVRLGEGIAGRVAQTRKAEVIASDLHPGARRDRPGAGSAVCAPIVWDGKLLGVLNISADDEDGDLSPNALPVIESLTHRFGLILDRFLRIQMVRDGDLFRTVEEELSRDTRDPEAVAATLSAWARDLALVAGADRANLGVLTSDGDLFVAEAKGFHYETPPGPQKAEVLSTGRPMILRPGDLKEHDPTDMLRETTVFHLPVGQDPARGLLSVHFSSPGRAHHFHSISGEILYLVTRHLADFLDRVATADQVDRLTTLASALSDLALWDGSLPPEQRVMAAACRLTGAAQAYLLQGPPAPPAGPPQAALDRLEREAARLLAETGARGWQSTTLTTEPQAPAPGDHGAGTGRSLLVVPLGREYPFPGLVLVDKQRLHPLDGAAFTEFDALFARRLLPLLSRRRAKSPAQYPPEFHEQAPASASAGQAIQAVVPAAAEFPRILKREMDRCDRYHTSLGLAAFRPQALGIFAGKMDELVARLTPYLRSSDTVCGYDAATILVLVPEDVQSLLKLQKRVIGILQQLIGNPELPVPSSSRPYPGGAAGPSQLLSSVIASLA